jgi:hypothetical protein
VVFLICDKCQRQTDLGKFESELGRAYLIALADKEFLEFLKKEAESNAGKI